MQYLYSLGILLYGLLVRLASLYNVKAKKWLKGRQKIFDEIENFNPGNKKLIWIHCASLGEFEQGRPIIERIKFLFPETKLILTFFSPSGYEIRKNYELADLVTYMPLDTKRNARKFVNMLKPDLAIFVKYEFWHHHFRALFKIGCPVILVSAIFRPEQIFFKNYGKWFRATLKQVEHFFLQDEKSKQLLSQLGIRKYDVSGDTRFDRVFQLQNDKSEIKGIKAFCDNKPLLIFGSTWPADEEFITEYINSNSKDLKFIIAAHEIKREHLNEIKKALNKKSIFYSDLLTTDCIDEIPVLIIDNIGMLNRLYSYGKIAYVGGGFGAGIHNILEPAAYGLPVIIGPNYRKFKEAVDLVEKGGAFVIHNQASFNNAMDGLIDKPENYTISSEICKTYILENKGATEMIIKYISEKLSSNS